MSRGKLCIAIGFACLMVICSAPAFLAQSSDLVAYPPQLDFGVVYVGESAKMPVAVTNEGGSALYIDDLEFVGDYGGAFSLVDPPALSYKLFPGQSVDVWVQFSPPDFSLYSAQLHVVPNVSATLIVPLWGFGDFLPPCEYDPDGDQDTDGSDLAEYIKDPKGVDLIFFVFDLGRTNCPESD
jgi:hypothetical protein